MKLTQYILASQALAAVESSGETDDSFEAQSAAIRMIGQIPVEDYLLRDTARVRPLDVSDTMYTCPKDGYLLIDDECVYETRIESRFDCPPGYAFNGVLCETFQPVQWRCQNNGSFINGKCQHLEVYDTNIACPAGSSLSAEGLCISLEPVTFVDVCPSNTIRSPAGCLAVEYHEPIYVCPADFYLDGKKCRREVLKYKKTTAARLLSESEEIEPIELNDAAEASEILEDMVEQMEGETDLITYMNNPAVPEYAYILPSPHTENELPTRWIPAPEAQITLEPYQPYRLGSDGQPEHFDTLHWEKIPVMGHHPFPEAPAAAAPLPSLIISRGGVKTSSRKNMQPQQVIRVISQAAEKICPVGSRYGGACVSETITSPIKECPVPLIEGVCAKRVALSPIVTCQYNASLNCVGRTCRCEILRESLPFPTCRNPGFELYSDDQCVHQLIPRRLCPLGFFLDAEDAGICARRDVEPALTLFSVTYACSDCLDYQQPFTPGTILKRNPGVGGGRRSANQPLGPLIIEPARFERKQQRRGNAFELLGGAEAAPAPATTTTD